MLDLALTDNIFIYNQIDSLLQEIEIIFDTEQSELLGDTLFGSNFNNFLWNLNPNEGELAQYVDSLLNQCTYRNNFDIDINTEILLGSERDIYLLQLTITDIDGNKYEKKYAYK